MPKLYMSEVSPAVRAVLLTEKALNLQLEKILIDLQKKEQLTPEYLKINPQHTVPTLVDDDGYSIWDSHVIITYLVDKYGKTDELYPKDLKKRSVVNQRFFFETEKISGAIHKIFGPIRESKNPTPTPEAIELANNVYDLLDKFIGTNNYTAGKTLTIADFSLIVSTQMLNMLVSADPKYQNVHRWFKTMEKLPYYNIVNEGLEKAKGFIQMILKS